ncbi:hypothetical protein FB645_006131 [Coemansia sp. IMI 203386]|nr:hypothetical protein FB645_006131 [Coemansia sp. IMI 203386]
MYILLLSILAVVYARSISSFFKQGFGFEIDFGLSTPYTVFQTYVACAPALFVVLGLFAACDVVYVLVLVLRWLLQLVSAGAVLFHRTKLPAPAGQTDKAKAPGNAMENANGVSAEACSKEIITAAKAQAMEIIAEAEVCGKKIIATASAKVEQATATTNSQTGPAEVQATTIANVLAKLVEVQAEQTRFTETQPITADAANAQAITANVQTSPAEVQAKHLLVISNVMAANIDAATTALGRKFNAATKAMAKLASAAIEAHDAAMAMAEQTRAAIETFAKGIRTVVQNQAVVDSDGAEMLVEELSFAAKVLAGELNNAIISLDDDARDVV